MDYKLIIKHKLATEDVAEQFLSKMEANLRHSVVLWSKNRFWYEEGDYDWREFLLDVRIPFDNIEEACQEILDYFSEEYCALHLDYPSHKEKNTNNNEVLGAKMLAQQHPDGNKILYLSNTPFCGGMRGGAKFEDDIYSKIKLELESIGFFNIKLHTKQKHCYKIDFETCKISGKELHKLGWSCNVLGTWSKMGISIKYPNQMLEGRETDANWYEPQIEYEVHEVKNHTFYDFSGDDSSLNPALW